MFLDLNFKKILKKLVYFLSKDDMRTVDAMIHARLMEGTPTYPEHLHYAYWENQIDFWDGMPSPVRPSSGDMEIYRSFLTSPDKEERILILGSTPELRDLAAQRPDAKIYVADFSYRMLLAMLPFATFVNPMRERWIRDNWLDLSFPQDFFDVILGDLVLQQFPPELESALLKKMQTILKKDAAFIGRFHFLDSRMQKTNIAEVVRETLANRGGPQEKIILLKLRILWLFADPEKRLLNREISAREFEKFVRTSGTKDAIVRRALVSLCADQDSYRNWSPPTEEELIRILSLHFDILNRKTATDYEDAFYYPIYALRPKHNT